MRNIIILYMSPFSRFCMLGGAGIFLLALLVDGKFLWQGILGVLMARLPEGATESDRRRVGRNRIKWLLALPYFMFISLERMREQHLAIASGKGIRLGAGYRITVIWHIFWLVILGFGYLSLYSGMAALLYGLVLRVLPA